MRPCYSQCVAELTITPNYDSERFRRLALYIASRSSNDPAFGKTKLAKLLFYRDFLAYGELGSPITGATYSKFPYGPFPRVLSDELNKLEDLGEGVVVPADYFGQEQERLVALKEIDAAIFSSPEISIVEQVLEALRDEDAAGVARLSHLEPAWQFVEEWKAIPYELAFVSGDPPSEEALRVGEEVAERLGLVSSAQ